MDVTNTTPENKYADEKGYNFRKMLTEQGFIDAETGEYDEDKVAEEIGVKLHTLDHFVTGFGNPLRGKTFDAMCNVFDLEPNRLKAFLRWRADKMEHWQQVLGAPEEGEEYTDPETGETVVFSFWDDETEWQGAYLEEYEPEDEDESGDDGEGEEGDGLYDNEGDEPGDDEAGEGDEAGDDAGDGDFDLD